MQVIAIIGQKGGTGKTTVAVALAVTASRVGETVVILDVDPQGNALGWKARRDDENPVVLAVPPGRLRQAIDAARQNGADLIVIDTPGKNDAAAIEAAKQADLVLIPTRPLIFDMDTLPAARDFVSAAGNPPAFVLYNCVPPQGHALIDKLKAMTTEAFGLIPCPVHLTQRAIHPEAQTLGKAPIEVQAGNRAAEELQDLYLFTKNPPTEGRKHGGKKQSSPA